MQNQSTPIRNANGSLICETFYAEGVWMLRIKRKSCYTVVALMPDGSVEVFNDMTTATYGIVTQ